MKLLLLNEAAQYARKGERIAHKNGGESLVWRDNCLVFEISGEAYRPEINEHFYEKKEWMVIHEQCNCEWAAKEISQGKRVRRSSWNDTKYIYYYAGGIYDNNGYQYWMQPEDIIAKNWETAE